jgi:hypothetical protein
MLRRHFSEPLDPCQTSRELRTATLSLKLAAPAPPGVHKLEDLQGNEVLVLQTAPADKGCLCVAVHECQALCIDTEALGGSLSPVDRPSNRQRRQLLIFCLGMPIAKTRPVLLHGHLQSVNAFLPSPHLEAPSRTGSTASPFARTCRPAVHLAVSMHGIPFLSQASHVRHLR